MDRALSYSYVDIGAEGGAGGAGGRVCCCSWPSFWTFSPRQKSLRADRRGRRSSSCRDHKALYPLRTHLAFSFKTKIHLFTTSLSECACVCVCVCVRVSWRKLNKQTSFPQRTIEKTRGSQARLPDSISHTVAARWSRLCAVQIERMAGDRSSAPEKKLSCHF